MINGGKSVIMLVCCFTGAINCLVASHGGQIREILRVISQHSSTVGTKNNKHHQQQPTSNTSPLIDRKYLVTPPNTAFTHLTVTMENGCNFKLVKVHRIHDISHLE